MASNGNTIDNHGRPWFRVATCLAGSTTTIRGGGFSVGHNFGTFGPKSKRRGNFRRGKTNTKRQYTVTS